MPLANSFEFVWYKNLIHFVWAAGPDCSDGLGLMPFPDLVGMQHHVLQAQLLDSAGVDEDWDTQVVSAETHVAPDQGQWLDFAGHKLNHESWLKYGVDSPVIQHGAAWSFESEPPRTSWRNHPSALKFSEKCSEEID